MSESTRPGGARGKTLTVGILAAAMLAMLVTAPFASAAAPSPIAGGTTTLKLGNGLVKAAKQMGLKITPVKPSKIKGTTATFPVTGGSLELTTGAGEVTYSGGLKLKYGKKTATLRSFTVSTTGKTLSAKVGGRTVKVAKLVGASVTRLGFGDSIGAKKLKLTGAAATALNKALTPAPEKVKVKKNGKTTTKLLTVPGLFKANMVLGSSVTEVEPTTVNVTPTGSVAFNGATTLLGKLADVEVKLEPIPPTTAAGTVFTSGLTGGTISPLGTSGAVSSAGGIKMVQVLPTSATTSISTTITLGSIGVDLAAKTATVEVIGESNAESEGKKPLNLGNLGRSSIADLALTTTPSPATRTVTVGASATVQPVAAEVLEGFVKVYQSYYSQVTAKAAFEKAAKEGKPITEAEAQKIGSEAAAKKTANDNIVAGEPLGSFSFVATGE